MLSMMNSYSLTISAVMLFVAGPQSVAAHSWSTNADGDLGAGAMRQMDDGSHPNLEHRWCPPDQDPEACKAFYSTHNIPVTADIERPCQPGKSSPMAKVSVGGSIHVSWPFNGHDNSLADGTCVAFSVTSYASDPSASDFSPVGTCVPFYLPGQPLGGTDVSIPSTYGPGQYTMLWNWHYSGIWYSSCTDFEVAGGSSGASNLVAEHASAGSGETAQATEAAAAPAAPSAADYLDSGCGVMAADFCMVKLGPQSYCKSSNPDNYGRYVCFGDNHSMLNGKDNNRLLRRILL